MPPIDRRNFIRQAMLGSSALASGLLTGCNNDGNDSVATATVASFTHGVASGDLLADRVILWTRVLPSANATSTSVTWEVASDAAFANVVSKGETKTDAARDYTVKVDASGLSAGNTYYYRFKADTSVSPVGKTRTLPQASPDEVKLAVFSCANYPAGYFHVYAEAAKRDDLFAAIHLGDYIYEYPAGADQYASADAAKLGRVSSPANELVKIDDYRQRYAQYRSDKDLQAVHAKLPFICIWDDHEIANDTWKDGAENHTTATEGDFALRRAAALKAWQEWLPVREQDASNPLRAYRSFNFGTLLSLHMLDTRAGGRDKQLDYATYIDPTTGAFNATTFAADMADPTRQLLGAEQMAWLQSQLAASGAIWQVLGQQILMGNAWDGYAVARETVFGTARALDKNLVVLSGDTHNAWASDLQDVNGNAIGVEFATPSVSSPGLEEYIPDTKPAELAAGVQQLIPTLAYADTAQRGYMVLSVNATEAKADWYFVSSVKTSTYTTKLEKSLKTLASTGNRRIVRA